MRRSGKGMLVFVMAEGEESDGREHCVWRLTCACLIELGKT
jgi:hypothetical protein